MSILKNVRLGLLHVAVAITFVLINGVLNRVMIHDMGILATVVAVLTILPYILSPMQVLLGQYSDTHPVWGYRRTPYIALGLLLCVGGAVLTPYAAFLMRTASGGLDPLGLLVGLLTFGAWGIGFNLSVVAYLALASDLSAEQQRSRTIAVMWFMMIVSLIVTGITVGRALDPYSDAQLLRVFALTGRWRSAWARSGWPGWSRAAPWCQRRSRAPASARRSRRCSATRRRGCFSSI
jgi:BCD family chlorophyll transporter-like MFS transporter